MLNVLVRLLDVTSNVESITWSLGNGEAEVEGYARGNDANTDQGTPHLVDSNLAVASALSVGCGLVELALEASDEADHDDSSTKLAETLHGEHGAHHSATPLGGSELRGDDGGKRVVTANSCNLLVYGMANQLRLTYQYP